MRNSATSWPRRWCVSLAEGSLGRTLDGRNLPGMVMRRSVARLWMFSSTFLAARAIWPSSTYPSIPPWRTNRAYLPSTNRCMPSLTYSSAKALRTAGHESIKPLCLQAEIDVLVVCWKEHNVLPTGFLCQVSIDFHVLVTNEKHMPAAVLAVYERRIQLDGNIVLMCRLPWLLHIVPGTNDEGQNDGN
jgi:hypothetical protein